MQLPHCPKCDSTYTYEDNGMYICPECAHDVVGKQDVGPLNSG
jgi:alkylphosphonate utilization operon protein PhnA